MDTVGMQPTGSIRQRTAGFSLADPRPDARQHLAIVEGLTGSASLPESELAARFLELPAQTWVKRLLAAGIAAHPYLDIADVMEDPITLAGISALLANIRWDPAAALGYPGETVRPERARSRLDTIPLGRVGEPNEFAAVAAFLAGLPAAFVTGAVIPVDGGYSRALL